MFVRFRTLIFVTYLHSLVESRRIDENLQSFIVDVASSLYLPSTVLALVCLHDVVSEVTDGENEELCGETINETEPLCFSEDGLNFSRYLSRNNVMNDVRKSFEGLDPTRLRSVTSHRDLILLDLDCFGAIDFLMKASNSRMFVAPTKWLLLQDLRGPEKPGNGININDTIAKDDLSSIHKHFRNLDMFPDSEIIIGRRINEDFVRVTSPYRPGPRGELILEDRGNWTRDKGLVFRDRDPTSRRRQNLRQTELKSCLVLTNTDTFNHLEDYRDKHVDAVTKANYPWVLHLTRRMNATVTFTSQNTWGYRDKNGSWSGMIGLLDRREIDLGGTATFFTSDRIGVVEYIQLYTPTGSKFLFRRPPLSYVSNLFTLPFGRSVWIAIGILLAVVIGLLYLAMKWEYVMRTKEENPQAHWSGNIDEVPTMSDNLLVVIGAVSQQGSYYEPRDVPTRIIVLMLLVCALSLYASYTANIVALLQSTATSINTPRDLMESPLKIGIYDIVYNRYYFEAAQDPERKEFYEIVVKGKKGVWMSLAEGISRVRKGLFAFHVEVGAGYQLMQETFEEDEKCGIHAVDYLNLLKPLLVIQYQSPYLEIIRVGALWIRETGLQYRETSRLYTDKPVCHGHNSFLSVGVTECYAALLTMAYGIGITFAILLLEIIWHKWSSVKPEEDASAVEFLD